jgi:predicted nucleic acid-binding protein
MAGEAMKIAERLQTVTRVFLDTAPVIYYVEANPRYRPIVEVVFDRLDNGALTAVTSPVTLAECLVFPYRLGQSQTAQDFADLIVNGSNTVFALIEQDAAKKAADLRVRYNLSLTDAFQVAVAIASNCDAFLTNDIALKRVIELGVLVLDEMEL